MKDLKERAIRGGVARTGAQAASFALRLVSLMILARLLAPGDFGLVGMVTAFTGILDLFRDFGLSAATVQRQTVTEAQVSTLFWINCAVGVFLALIMVAVSPFIADFYHEPRLRGVTIALACGMIFNALGIQHSAALQREMRFTSLAVVGVVSLILGTLIAIGGAKAGYGYWSLVAMTVSLPLTTTAGLWFCSGWIPGWPRRRAGIRSLMRFGSTLTFNGFIVYVATNFDKVLLGRYWGPDIIGIYGRAYQLINIPTTNLNSIAGEIAFSALSRLQDDPIKRRNYFLAGFSLVLSFTVPLTMECAFFSSDAVVVLLGPKWAGVSPIFRWLAPTILVFAIANPLSWLLSASGRISRLMKMSMVIAPIMILAYIVGLPHGPQGVACAYSVVMVLWLVPLTVWALHGTEVSVSDIAGRVAMPLVASLFAGGLALWIGVTFGGTWSPLIRLVSESSIFFSIYVALLTFDAKQRQVYREILRGLVGRRLMEKPVPAST